MPPELIVIIIVGIAVLNGLGRLLESLGGQQQQQDRQRRPQRRRPPQRRPQQRPQAQPRQRPETPFEAFMRAMKDAAEEQARLEEFPETPARRPQRPQPQRSVRPQPAPAPEPSQRGLLAQHHLTSGVGSQHLDSTVAGQHLGSQVARQHLVSSLAGRPETRRTERETGTPNLLADLERRLNPLQRAVVYGDLLGPPRGLVPRRRR